MFCGNYIVRDTLALPNDNIRKVCRQKPKEKTFFNYNFGTLATTHIYKTSMQATRAPSDGWMQLGLLAWKGGGCGVSTLISYPSGYMRRLSCFTEGEIVMARAEEARDPCGTVQQVGGGVRDKPDCWGCPLHTGLPPPCTLMCLSGQCEKWAFDSY